MTTLVVASTRFAALHRWPLAPITVSYLRDRHRHEFHVTVWKRVAHADREVEIIQLKWKVEAMLSLYAGVDRDFGDWSCERIAQTLLRDLKLERVAVLEDGENGAEVSR